MAEQEKQRQPVECIIRVDGKEITEMYPFLRSVSVETSRKAAAICSLSFESVRDEYGLWSVQDSGWFIPWRRIRIEAAFGSYTEEVMRGFIREIKADYPEDMSATVVVECQDESFLLDREHMQVVFSTTDEPATDGDLVKQITQNHWTEIEAASGLKNGALHYNGTQIRFLLDRAEANGFEFLIREGRVYFGPPQLDGEPQSALMIYAGDATNCLRFSVLHDGHKPDEVRLVCAPETGTETVSETYSSRLKTLGRQDASSWDRGLDPFVWNLERVSGATIEERQVRARAKADEVAWKLQAEGELDGVLYGHVLLTHRTVTVDGVGETYGGVWYVDEVKHEFTMDGYRQTFRLLRNATGESVVQGKSDPLAMVGTI